MHFFSNVNLHLDFVHSRLYWMDETWWLLRVQTNEYFSLIITPMLMFWEKEGFLSCFTFFRGMSTILFNVLSCWYMLPPVRVNRAVFQFRTFHDNIVIFYVFKKLLLYGFISWYIILCWTIYFTYCYCILSLLNNLAY